MQLSYSVQAVKVSSQTPAQHFIYIVLRLLAVVEMRVLVGFLAFDLWQEVSYPV